MFFGSKRQVPSREGSTNSTNPTMYVDNEVRSAVEQEFSRMDELHARIRAEALASQDLVQSNSQKPTRSPTLLN